MSTRDYVRTLWYDEHRRCPVCGAELVTDGWAVFCTTTNESASTRCRYGLAPQRVTVTEFDAAVCERVAVKKEE